MRVPPVALTPAADELAAALMEPWDERAQLYHLLVKGSGPWDELWPDVGECG